jgi:seryl-tRNA synthetase
MEKKLTKKQLIENQKKYSEIILKLIEEKNQLKEEAEKDFKKLESKIYDLHYEVEQYEEENLKLTAYEQNFKWVAIWEKSERYGGAEEGGWWFNHLSLVKAFHVPEEAIQSVKKWFDEHPLYSNSKMKNLVPSDEQINREIEIYGDFQEPSRFEESAKGEYTITFENSFPKEDPFPTYE